MKSPFLSIVALCLICALPTWAQTLGATVGDLLTKTHEKGGLDFGTIGSSAILGTVLVALVV